MSLPKAIKKEWQEAKAQAAESKENQVPEEAKLKVVKKTKSK